MLFKRQFESLVLVLLETGWFVVMLLVAVSEQAKASLSAVATKTVCELR
jgi:hypothetical protein